MIEPIPETVISPEIVGIAATGSTLPRKLLPMRETPCRSALVSLPGAAAEVRQVFVQCPLVVGVWSPSAVVVLYV